MEGLAPPIKLSSTVIFHLSAGQSLEHSLNSYFADSAPRGFPLQVKSWLLTIKQQQPTESLFRQIKSPYRKSLLRLLHRGLDGHSILTELIDLEKTILCEQERELSQFVTVLPFKAMVPLFAFQFPAFLILFLGPLLETFIRSMQ